MFVFVCAGCGAELTAPLSQVVLPVHAHQKYGNAIQLPVLMESGTFAVEPAPSGPPWRRWEEIDPDELVARGIHAPVHILSDGAPGAIVIAPGDVRGTVLIPEKCGGYCCGLDGADGPNLACETCGLPVASRIDDCSLWQAVWLAPDAVRRRPRRRRRCRTAFLGGAGGRGEECTAVRADHCVGRGAFGGVPLVVLESAVEAAAGRALAHLLAASEGRPVTVPDGLTEEVFQRALDTLLPAGPPARRAVLAGPGLPAPDTDVDILIVPVHPQTGETWAPPSPAASAHPVPLPFGVWLWLAFPEPHLPAPASGVMPDGVLRDDPPAPHPCSLFRPDPGVFWHTLVRLPAVRSQWLRGILGTSRRTRARLF